MVKVRNSSYDIEGAEKDLNSEIAGWDFNGVKKGCHILGKTT